MLDDFSLMRVPPSRTTTPKGSPEALARMARAREFKATYLHLGITFRKTSADPWRPCVLMLRRVIRAMLDQPKRYTSPQVLVAQATLAVLCDPAMTGPTKVRTVAMFGRVLGAFDKDRSLRDDPLRPDPEVEREKARLADPSIPDLIRMIRSPPAPNPLASDEGGGSVGR